MICSVIDNSSLQGIDNSSLQGSQKLQYLKASVKGQSSTTGAVIDNSSLQGSQKLQYLKASVKGDAAKLLASIPVTDHNFDIAMNTLINRYENKRIIIRTHLHSIVSYRSLTTDNARDLRNLIEAMDEHRLALQNLGEPVNSQDIFFVYLISEKLPTETRKQWELSSKGKEPQRYAELRLFLEERAQALEATAPNGVGATKTQMNGNQRHLHTHLATSEQQCECCEETHKIFKCGKFKKLSVRERAELIKVRKLCFNSLRPGHRSEDCDGSKCKQCGRKHHTLLHRENIQNKNTNQQTTSGTTSTQANDKQKNNAITTTAIAKAKDENKFTGAMTQRTSEEVFLQTAIVAVNVHGETILLRALLDSASQNNLITESAVQRLQLKKKSSNTKVFGLGGTVQDNKGRVDLLISSRNRSSTVSISASVLTKMTDNLPSRFIDTSQWETVKELELADPDFNKPSSIDLLIGASHYEDIMIGNNRLKEPNCGITYRLSMFGWVVIGREQTDKTYTNDLQTFFVSSEPENLQRFWEIEEVPAAQLWTAEEKRCDDHFKETTRRSPEGRFIVKLPFKKETKALGDSLQQAKKRLRSLLFRLERQPDLYKRYAEFIGEFFHLGHMEKVPTSELVKPVENCYYLCHHCVFKESSTTTKLRVVFDGSAKTTTGVSLNDRLMVGPKIQKDLFSILVRFRLHQVALSADIAKMYRQVELDKEDKDYHRLLWKDPNSEAIETFRMTRVTYGIASSSFHSIRPLQVLAEETTNTKLRLSLTTDMYVDDLLTGCEDSEAAEKLQDAIITLLASAGFDIRKWVSSDSKLASRLAATFRETEDEKIIESEDYAIKTLGIRWNPNPDQFGFTVKLDKGTPFTKRQILSEVSRLFDPLGWLSPTTIQHKSFVQLLWMDKLSWDQPFQTQFYSSTCDFEHN